MSKHRSPFVGATVLFNPRVDDSIARANNNEGPIAAIVTRVWSDTCVNLKLVPDCGPMQDRTSVVHKSDNPASYSWQWGDSRDDITDWMPTPYEHAIMWLNAFTMWAEQFVDNQQDRDALDASNHALFHKIGRKMLNDPDFSPDPIGEFLKESKLALEKNPVHL